MSGKGDFDNQNINTMNLARTFDKKEATFGRGRGLAGEFDRINEESYMSNGEKN